MFKFEVIDLQTNQKPNLKDIVCEDWAQYLEWYRIEGFMLDDCGSLILTEGFEKNSVYCPHGRFKVIIKMHERKDYSYIY